MNRLKERTLWKAILLAVVFLYACFSGHVVRNVENRFLAAVLSLSRHLLQVGMITYWFVSIRQRIISKTIRRYLLWAAALIGFWLYIRTVKWMFLNEGDWGRYIWYAYYIPLILIPMFGVFIVQCIGKPQNYHLPDRMKFLYIPALLLVGLIFTNDYHQMAFGFPSGIQHYNDQYTYHIVYFLVLIWCICLGLYFSVMLLVKSRAPGKQWGRRFPFIVLSAGILLTALYCLRIVIYDMTAVNCFLIVLLLEGSIQSGLIRSNSRYGELFSAATIDASITDLSGKTYYSSKSAAPIPDLPENTPVDGTFVWNDKRLNRAEISNGYIYWWDDISGILRYTKELEKTGRHLEENNDLLKAELILQEKRVAISEKNRLYDRLAKDSAPYYKKLEELLEIEMNRKKISDEEMKKYLTQICVLCAYIKRRSNLILMAENTPEIVVKELEYAFTEILNNVRLTGTECISNFCCSGVCYAELLVSLLDACEEVILQQLFGMDLLLLSLRADQEQLSLCLQITSEKNPSLENNIQWEAYGGKKEVRREAHTFWISFTWTRSSTCVKGENNDEFL